MPAEPWDADDPALAEALDEYLAALHTGGTPDRQQLLAKHPALAGALECLDALERLAPPGSNPHAPTTDSHERGEAKPAASPPAREFGKYELLGEIGRGGMGVVYRARQKELDRVVAIKVILAGQLASEEHVRRFVAEARAAARVQHPNIVRVHEAGEIHGQHYFAMEFIAGSSLAACGPLDVADAARLVCTVARAVEHLHSQGIVHRDLKPSNILLDEHGQPFVTDFGLAKFAEAAGQATQSGVIAGTPSYMPPEQAAGHASRIGPRSDVYSLGAILYELLAGRPPFRADSPLDTLVQVIESEPTLLRALNPRVPRELEMICLRCLEKSPEQRYASAAALADDLERFLKGEAVEAQPPGAWQQLRRWTRRQPALASRLCGLTLCAVIAQANYLFTHNVALALHLQIMGVLALWVLASVVCQWLLDKPRAAGVRFVWAGVDVLLLTAVLKLDDAVASPLVVAYPLLIVASGLWFRTPLVAFTTALSAVAYGALILDAGTLPHLNWHLIFIVALAIVGFMVAYQVHRVRALSRYYERRPLP